jgi:lipoprotein signal peptidase
MSTKSPRSYRWLLWTLALLGVGLDQLGKYVVFDVMYEEATVRSPLGRKAELTVIPGALKFHVEYAPEQDDAGYYLPHVNRGAFLGFGNSDGEGPNYNLAFAVVSVLAAAAIVWWSTRPAISRDALLCTALGLILGGTLGNLYDRIVFQGVRDYLYWFFIQESAVFNIADFMLICGAVLLLVQAFWGKHAAEGRRPAEPADNPQMAEAK